jgi:hypothetical protein
MLNPCYVAPIWLIWKELPILEKLSFLVLCVVAGYSIFLAATVVRLQNIVSLQANIALLRKRVRNLQRTTVAAFYFLGFAIFAGFQFAYCNVAGDSSESLVWLVVRNLLLHFAYAANVFLILLVVHVVQWFIANQLNALGSQANS